MLDALRKLGVDCLAVALEFNEPALRFWAGAAFAAKDDEGGRLPLP